MDACRVFVSYWHVNCIKRETLMENFRIWETLTGDSNNALSTFQIAHDRYCRSFA